jgi:hypothetical protein
VALTALDRADRGELSIHSPVTVTKADLTLFNQPIAQMIGANGYTTTLDELMRRAMQQSDNTCNDFVLWRAGGPDAVRDFLQRKGISGIRFGPGERVMQSRIAGMEWKPYMAGSAFYAARNAVRPASAGPPSKAMLPIPSMARRRSAWWTHWPSSRRANCSRRYRPRGCSASCRTPRPVPSA